MQRTMRRRLEKSRSSGGRNVSLSRFSYVYSLPPPRLPIDNEEDLETEERRWKKEKRKRNKMGKKEKKGKKKDGTSNGRKMEKKQNE